MMRMAWLVIVAALVAGCGSGGSSVSAEGHGLGPPSQTQNAAVSVSTRAASAATVMYGVSFTLKLPSGVSVAADATTGEVSAGVLQPHDTRAVAGGRYVPATASAPASVIVQIADPQGFPVGDVATINCTVQPATEVTAADFRLSDFSARNQDGAAMSGITTQLTAQIK